MPLSSARRKKQKENPKRDAGGNGLAGERKAQAKEDRTENEAARCAGERRKD